MCTMGIVMKPGGKVNVAPRRVGTPPRRVQAAENAFGISVRQRFGIAPPQVPGYNAKDLSITKNSS